jgi:hypothetical protein
VISATLRKLRYRPGARAFVQGAPASFETELAGAKEVARAEKPATADLVQVFYTRGAHLRRDATRLAAAGARGAILWICYPKGNALGTDLDRDVIRSKVAAWGLQAVAIVALDEVWSALRCKHRGVPRRSAR